MKKLFISYLVAILSIGLFAVSTVNAASDVSQLFKEFMDECFSDETNVTVFKGNQDVTKEFFDRYRDMYSNNELLIISNDIEYYGYDITHEIDMPVIRASTTKSKTFKSYEAKTVKGNKKEWTTILYCKFTYNPGTGNITSISNPQLNVDFGSWGSAFTPRWFNASTGKEKVGRLSVKFTCDYDVEATYDPPYLPASTWNFGHCSRSYTLKV